MATITPCLWFDGTAEQAAHYYCDLFDNARMITPATPTPRDAQPPVVVVWELQGQRLMAINGGSQYQLSPAFSLSVEVDGQAEVDRYWTALVGDGGTESMCGWLEDKFGVSWQIVPRQLVELMSDPDPEKARRVTEAMLKMRKIVVDDLVAAHRG